jgi:gamma-glutamyltranspeptidase/glutathione hydrolase
MGMLSHYPIAEMGPENIQSWRLLGDASRLAFADRGKYMADSDYVPMPTEGLLAADYIEQRATLLKRDTALTTTAAGKPPWSHAMNYALDEAIELPSTSHFSIVDKDRNMVSITTTIENGFGSRLMVRGFLLNNELTDFSFRSHADGVPIANRIEPGKRPRSSMAPTIVMKGGEPYMAVGSPGGSQIIGYVAKTLVAHLDWGLNLQQAINLPNMNNRFGAFELEQGTTAEQWAPKLEQLGFKVKVKELNSGVQAIRIDGKSLMGAADPRREGKVIAQ